MAKFFDKAGEFEFSQVRKTAKKNAKKGTKRNERGNIVSAWKPENK